MTIKKTDWLRHLYSECTRWRYSLTGQVKWRDMPAKDPNNGSKMTVEDLEEALPNMLQDCIQNHLVPALYMPEVSYFHSVVGQKIDNVLLGLVQTRKKVLSLKDSLEMFCGLSESDKIKVVSMLDASIYTDVMNLLTRLQGMGILEGCELIGGQEDDKSSKFKLIDWLRHMYLVCQKWLNQEAGQIQWSKLNAQDPNNSKDGKRMKMEELKQSLKVLVPGLQDNIVPRVYRSEIGFIRRVLCCNDGKFVNRILAAEEHLRKAALKLEEVFRNLGDPQQVLEAIDPAQLPTVLSAVFSLKKHLEANIEVENFDGGDMVEVVPDLLENEILEEPFDDEEIVPNILNNAEIIPERETLPEDIHERKFGPMDETESDGTEFLMNIIDKLSEPKNNATLEVHTESVASPSNADSSPPSPDSHRLSVDEPLSDDSGFYSPEHNNFPDQEEADVQDDIDLKFMDLEDAEELEGFDINISELDFECLPDIEFTDAKPEFSMNNRKRRLSSESYEEPAIKRAKP